MTPAETERIKLTATFLNSTAIAFITAAVVAPIVGLSIGLIRADVDPLYLAGGCCFWFVVGVILHFIAKDVLGGLR